MPGDSDAGKVTDNDLSIGAVALCRNKYIPPKQE
jgi:hypothetical protein